MRMKCGIGLLKRGVRYWKRVVVVGGTEGGGGLEGLSEVLSGEMEGRFLEPLKRPLLMSRSEAASLPIARMYGTAIRSGS